MLYFLVLSLFLPFHVAQDKVIDYNLNNGTTAEGYDVVAYFQGAAKKGSDTFVLRFKGARYFFSSAENKAAFKADPAKFEPMYGGWCAYAMGKTGDKISINPKTYEIRHGKLYLFYNAWGNNTKKKWLSEGPEKLRKQADANWLKVCYK